MSKAQSKKDSLKKGSRSKALSDDPELSNDALFQKRADDVYAELLARVGEANPQPRLAPTRRVLELLGDPQKSYPVIHIAGTNGKTSTSRLTESILRAYGLRTGLLTSPHLLRVNERIVIDGVPVSNEAFIENWRDIQPYLAMVDTELTASGDMPLTFFEALTVLAFACFADAPVDVAVIEVGMGGEWDSTNVADGQVAVFTPISLDHVARLGSTVGAIARTKSGIIKPEASVVSALQPADALLELRKAADASEVRLSVQGEAFTLISNTVAVGGQVIAVRGRAGTYSDLFLPLFGDHQAQNAAVAIAAVESFLGDGEQALAQDVIEEGLATATSPGRLQVISVEPTVLVDAAHNPDGASALTAAVGTYFTFDDVAVVLGVLEDKDAEGIIRALLPLGQRFHVTASSSERAVSSDDLAYIVRELAGNEATYAYDTLSEALASARAWAGEEPKRAVVVAGSITLVADSMALAAEEGWQR
ncbi:MAG: folylpolyglutamate synthase [Homoserinimonas sp.]|nr:folylpolyglutamate synthase [Homoserinimonas sp.]